MIAILLAVVVVVAALAAGIYYYLPSGQQKKEYRVGMLLTTTPLDGGYTYAGYNGLMELRDTMNVNVSYVEYVSAADAERLMRAYADKGYDMVIAHGFAFETSILKVAPDYPKTAFVWSGGKNMSGTNVATIVSTLHESSYLAGMVAAGISKTGIISYQSGSKTGGTAASFNAYVLGAKKVNANITVLENWIGVMADVQKGKEGAKALIAAGSDVCMSMGDGQSRGSIEGCQEAGKYAIGSIVDQNVLAPNTVVTSVVYYYGPIYIAIWKDVMAGNFKSQIFTWGLSTNCTGIAPYHGLAGNVSTSVQLQVNQTIADIKSGAFAVPNITA